MKTVGSKATGEPVELVIERLGRHGDGVASYDGAPVFLPFTVPGDCVRAVLGAGRGGGREGRVVEWLVRGPASTEPACTHFGSCGGCALQHLDAAFYRAAKLGGLRAALNGSGSTPAWFSRCGPYRRRAGGCGSG